jgi:hypothetical protein
VTDAGGNPGTDPVTIALGLNPTADTLYGTLTRTPVNGSVTFDNLSIASMGTYTLSAKTGALAPVLSTPFTITLAGPGATDVVLLDTRAGGAQAFNNITNVNDALSVFARPGDGFVDTTRVRPAKDSSGWSFTTNADGNGLHALRADWTKSSDPCPDPGCNDEGIRVVQYLPDGGPFRGGTPTRELFVQWKNRLGRYAFDTDANGAADSYAISLPNGSCKRALFSNADDYRRVDFALTRGVSPIGAQLEVNDQNYAFEAPTDRWNLEQVLGANVRPYTTTMHVVAASSDTVRDGLVEMWVDGTLVFSVHDVPMSAEAFDRWEFPTICVEVPQPQSEYFWDFVVWKPQTPAVATPDKALLRAPVKLPVRPIRPSITPVKPATAGVKPPA